MVTCTCTNGHRYLYQWSLVYVPVRLVGNCLFKIGLCFANALTAWIKDFILYYCGLFNLVRADLRRDSHTFSSNHNWNESLFLPKSTFWNSELLSSLGIFIFSNLNKNFNFHENFHQRKMKEKYWKNISKQKFNLFLPPFVAERKIHLTCC